jgi:hypothetical protein
MLFVMSLVSPQIPCKVVAAASNAYSVKAKSSKELLSLMKKLRAQGASVELTRERIRQPFFSSPARIVNINGEPVQVFEFPQASAAGKEAMLVSPDGMTVGTSKPSWMAPPHFFKSGRLLVLYLGTDPQMLKILHGALGKQFAGAE